MTSCNIFIENLFTELWLMSTSTN